MGQDNQPLPEKRLSENKADRREKEGGRTDGTMDGDRKTSPGRLAVRERRWKIEGSYDERWKESLVTRKIQSTESLLAKTPAQREARARGPLSYTRPSFSPSYIVSSRL